MVFMGIGGWEVVVLLAMVAIAVLAVAVLFTVVRAATACGVRRAQRVAEQTREDRQG